MYAKTHAHTNTHAHTLTVVDGVVLWQISMFVTHILVFTLSTMSNLSCTKSKSHSTTLLINKLAVSKGMVCG